MGTVESFLIKDGAIAVFNMIDVIQKNKQYLSDIDGAIGDGDHGVNMNKGFTIAKERLEGRDVTLSEALDVLGNVLLGEIGGSMGPIYGSFFIDMAESIEDIETIDQAAFGKMIRAGLEGIQDLVPTVVGDKTMIDCLVPAFEAYNAATASGESFIDALAAMKDAAEKGKDATKDMVAKVGRASRLGERSRGVPDAGATSCNLIIQSLCDAAVGLLK